MGSALSRLGLWIVEGKMRVVLADDHVMVLDALQAYLTTLHSDIRITRATSFEGALRGVSEGDVPDLVVLDVKMPGMHGLRGFGAMKERLPCQPIGLMSGQADGPFIREALRRGAAGFVTKDMSGRSIMNAFELMLEGGVYVPPVALSLGDGIGAAENTAVSDCERTNSSSPLSLRQQQVMDLLAQGMTNKQIARSLVIKEVTVALHVKTILRKLNVSNRTAAVRAALKMGLCA